ncbi:MAG: ATP-binding protein [Acidobacteriaceae bacterium]
MTSNRPVDDWGKLLGDSAAVTAMLDRLLHHGHVLKCGPRSWRTLRRSPRIYRVCSAKIYQTENRLRNSNKDSRADKTTSSSLLAEGVEAGLVRPELSVVVFGEALPFCWG